MDDKVTLERRGQNLRIAIDKVIARRPDAKPLVLKISRGLDALDPKESRGETIKALTFVQDNLRERARALVEKGFAKEDEFKGLL